MKIPFSKPYLTGNEMDYIQQLASFSGDGVYTRFCHEWLINNMDCVKALLTHSGTAALEMASLLIDVQPGDEIIMPSFTFSSTANAFVLRGAVPVFVDIRSDTLNLDENLIEAAITPKTKAIVPVHYAGVACAMDVIMNIASRYHLYVIEDAAHGFMASYKGKSLGTIGALGAYSFHETKNIISGEGGAIIINDDQFSNLAEIIREKGTDRSQFYRGQIDKYTWQHLGSSYLPSELVAAFLFAQLEDAKSITDARLTLWNHYHVGFLDFENREMLKRPFIPEDCQHNGHMYYILVSDLEKRTNLIQYLKSQGMMAVSHYVPLHTSPGGKKYCRIHHDLARTEALSDHLVRLPLFVGMDITMVDRVIHSISEVLHF